MPISTQLTHPEAVRSRHSNLCPACGGEKRGGLPLCVTCDSTLAPVLRSGVRRVGGDYAASMSAALAFLGVEKAWMPDT